jgi:uncharacterized protein with GYD domain
MKLKECPPESVFSTDTRRDRFIRGNLQQKFSKGWLLMATYLLFGKYSQEALSKISAKRTQGTAAFIKKHGGELKAGYALLGDVDIVLVADLPDNATAMKVSIALSKQLGVGFRTAPALAVDAFDKLMA